MSRKTEGNLNPGPRPALRSGLPSALKSPKGMAVEEDERREKIEAGTWEDGDSGRMRIGTWGE